MAGLAGSSFGSLPDVVGSVRAGGETLARLRSVQDPAAAPGWRAEGSARGTTVRSCPFFRTRSKAARQPLCPRSQVQPGVAICLLGAEPGAGGRTAISLCRSTGCADLLTLVRTDCNMLLKFARIAVRQSAGRGTLFNTRRIFWYLMPPECQKS